MTDRVRELDEQGPPPTSWAEAVCRCCYDGAVRAYRCVACRSGFGPDRAHLAAGRFVTPGENPPRATLACWFCAQPAVTVGWGFAVCAQETGCSDRAEAAFIRRQCEPEQRPHETFWRQLLRALAGQR